jgi:hypothetical protein
MCTRLNTPGTVELPRPTCESGAHPKIIIGSPLPAPYWRPNPAFIPRPYLAVAIVNPKHSTRAANHHLPHPDEDPLGYGGARGRLHQKPKSQRLEITSPSNTKESKNAKIQNEANVHCCLQCYRNNYCWGCPTQSNHESEVLHRTFVEIAIKNLKNVTRVVGELFDFALGHCHTAKWQVACQKASSCTQHAPFSQDLTPCNFFLFPKLKHSLKGTYFQSTENFQKKMIRAAERGFKKLLSQMLPHMAWTYAVICRCQRELLWRR